MPRVFLGRTHDLYGKSLWELLCNLKDFGVGRVVKRTKFNRRYPEASWYEILSARPEMDPVSEMGDRGVPWFGSWGPGPLRSKI